MKLTSAALLAFLFALAALCPRAAEASTIVIRVPSDPVPCTGGVPPEGDLSVDTVATDEGTFDYVEVQDVPSVQSFANCTGTTVDDLYVLIVGVAPNSINPISFVGTDFDAADSGEVPLPTALTDALGLQTAVADSTVLEYALVCSDGDTSCTGMLEGDVGSATVPEPTAAELLLFAFGIYLLGFGGRRGWKAFLSRSVCQNRLVAS